ncbi:MAG: enoyl-CoA hydratase/isomerase family protein [Pseudomonadota bacterium]
MVTAMAYSTVQIAHDDAACIITLNRPDKRNAVSVQMMHEIATAATEAEADPGIVAVILTGGTAFFSAGADLNEALAVKTTPQALAYFPEWHRLNGTLEALRKPVIAAIEGFCITGGLELAMACDLRIAASNASFAITSAKIGTVAGAGGTQRLPRLVGPAKALELLFSADPIDAAEALRIGLVNRVVPTGQAVSEAKQLVQTYKARGPISLALAKQAVYRGMQMDLASAIDLETLLVTAIYGTQDKQEGISAFLEKRVPTFRGA